MGTREWTSLHHLHTFQPPALWPLCRVDDPGGGYSYAKEDAATHLKLRAVLRKVALNPTALSAQRFMSKVPPKLGACQHPHNTAFWSFASRPQRSRCPSAAAHGLNQRRLQCGGKAQQPSVRNVTLHLLGSMQWR